MTVANLMRRLNYSLRSRRAQAPRFWTTFTNARHSVDYMKFWLAR